MVVRGVLITWLLVGQRWLIDFRLNVGLVLSDGQWRRVMVWLLAWYYGLVLKFAVCGNTSVEKGN